MISFDDNDIKLCVDEIRSECFVSGILSFVVAISSFRFSFAQSLAFLKALAFCRKVFGASIIANDLSWVMRYSVGFVGASDGVGWVVYTVRRSLW